MATGVHRVAHRRIGIYGGTFNPIHYGHISIAREMVRQGFVEEVWMLITPQNPFKQADTDILPDHVRLQLAREALRKEKHISVSDFEFSLPRPSYTWDTLQALSETYRDNTFSLIIGADNWHAFSRWYRHEDIVANYPVLVFPRQHYPIQADTLPPSVTLVHTRSHNMSSTEIRNRIREGLSVSRMVPAVIRKDVERALLKAL